VKQVTNHQRIADLIAQGAHFYVGHSGGKDSWAQYAALREIVPTGQLHVVHADLGEIEWTGVKDQIRSAIDGHELLVAHAIHADGSPKDFFSAVRARRATLDRKGQFDSPAIPDHGNRFCTSDLKVGPIWKVIKAHAKTVPGVRIIVNCVGIRGDESPARAKKIRDRGTLNINAKQTGKGTVWQALDWWPIAHWSDAEVWQLIADEKLPVHPAYKAGNDRLSCVFCIFGSHGDLTRGAAARPDLLAKYADLEADVRTTMFNGETLAQRINARRNA
jgi:3'-phosphoadenosine 5'-phosphosulfate sulfotransferase (PAPS reductase)/FAD synthetase